MSRSIIADNHATLPTALSILNYSTVNGWEHHYRVTFRSSGFPVSVVSVTKQNGIIRAICRHSPQSCERVVNECRSHLIKMGKLPTMREIKQRNNLRIT